MKYYSDSYLIKNIKEKDNGEKLVDVKKKVRKIIVKKHNVIKANRGKIFVREGVARKLNSVINHLPKGYKLVIYDGYRNKKTQERYFLSYLKKLKKENPKLNEESLRKEAVKYVADPESFSPHLTGGAVDVSLLEKGRPILMGGFIENKDKKVTQKIKDNRNMLAKIMSKAGFVNYPFEWWHWSYGDRYWAAENKRKTSLYKEIR